jgi:hypothetical protein
LVASISQERLKNPTPFEGEVYEITVRKSRRGKKHAGDDGSGPQPARHKPWTREYYEMREAKLATLMTTLFDEEESPLQVLFLDDDPTRHINAKAWLKEVLKTSVLDIKHVRTVDQCIKALEMHEWDVVCLDHDLEDIHYNTTLEKSVQFERTGMDVVDYLIQEKIEPGAVLVHSWNPDASLRMKQKLEDAGLRVAKKEFGAK